MRKIKSVDDLVDNARTVAKAFDLTLPEIVLHYKIALPEVRKGICAKQIKSYDPTFQAGINTPGLRKLASVVVVFYELCTSQEFAAPAAPFAKGIFYVPCKLEPEKYKAYAENYLRSILSFWNEQKRILTGEAKA